MARKIKRRVFTDATKKRLVAKAFKMDNIAEVAADADIAHSMLRHWCRDKRYGGKASAFRMKSATAIAIEEIAKVLPQVKVAGAARKPRSLVATRFSCPWCGGPIKKEA